MGVCVLTWLLLYRPNLGLASYSNGYDTMINGTVVLKGSLYGRRHVNGQNACVPIQNSEEKAWTTGVCLGQFAARWPIVGHRVYSALPLLFAARLHRCTSAYSLIRGAILLEFELTPSLEEEERL